MIVTTEKTDYRGIEYYRIFICGRYIGYGFTEQDAYDFGLKYAEKEGLI